MYSFVLSWGSRYSILVWQAWCWSVKDCIGVDRQTVDLCGIPYVWSGARRACGLELDLGNKVTIKALRYHAGLERIAVHTAFYGSSVHQEGLLAHGHASIHAVLLHSYCIYLSNLGATPPRLLLQFRSRSISISVRPETTTRIPGLQLIVAFFFFFHEPMTSQIHLESSSSSYPSSSVLPLLLL